MFVYANEFGSSIPFYKIGITSFPEERYRNPNYKFVGECRTKDDAKAFEAKWQDIQALLYLCTDRFDSRSFRTIKELSMRFRDELSHEVTDEMIVFRCNSAKNDKQFRLKFHSELNALKKALEAKYSDISKKYRFSKYTKNSSYEEMFELTITIIKDCGLKDVTHKYKGNHKRMPFRSSATTHKSMIQCAIKKNANGFIHQLNYVMGINAANSKTSKMLKRICSNLKDKGYDPWQAESKWSFFIKRTIFPGAKRASQYLKIKDCSVDGLLLSRGLEVNSSNRKMVLDEWLAIHRPVKNEEAFVFPAVESEEALVFPKYNPPPTKTESEPDQPPTEKTALQEMLFLGLDKTEAEKTIIKHVQKKWNLIS